MIRTDPQYLADREVENTPEPQTCEVCGEPTHDLYWDRRSEPHACCSSMRCERVMFEREHEDEQDAAEDFGRER